MFFWKANGMHQSKSAPHETCRLGDHGGSRSVLRTRIRRPSAAKLIVGSSSVQMNWRSRNGVIVSLLAGDCASGKQVGELPMNYEISGKVSRDVAVATMVNEVRSWRNKLFLA
jgi:hypothetical protein